MSRTGSFGVALIGNDDADAGIQECLLTHTLQKDFVIIPGGLKDLRIRLKGDGRAGLLGIADDFQRFFILAAVEMLEMLMRAVLDVDLQPFGQRIDDRSADAVQTAGDLVAAAAELTAGMEHGIHDRCRRDTLGRVDAGRDAASVIGHADDVIRQDIDGNFRTEAGKRLINGVIDDLIHEVMQTVNARRADIHARTLPDRVKTLQHLYLFRAVDFFFHVLTPYSGGGFRGALPGPAMGLCPSTTQGNAPR